MADREITGGIVNEWVLAHEGEDDDEKIERTRATSPATYFHMKGKES